MSELTLGQEVARLALAAAAVITLTLAGGLLPLVREWSKDTIRVLLAFGVGVLLGASFLHMLPESIHALGGRVGVPVLAGFLLIYLLERFMMLHACEEEGCHFHRMGMAAYVGITLHSLIDGFALGAGLRVPELSLPVTAAILLHKLPAALSLSGILLHCEYPRRRIVVMMALFSISTPVGAALAYGVLRELSGDTLYWAVAFSAGTFLAIATADLLPQVHSEPRRRWVNLAALFAGILVIGGSADLAHRARPGHDHGPSPADLPAGPAAGPADGAAPAAADPDDPPATRDPHDPHAGHDH